MSRELSAFVGLGSNVGGRLEHLRRAVRALDRVEGVAFRRSSAVYETEPVGPPQPDFLNACVELRTTLGPRELLEALKAVEDEVGRLPRERWGPREIDLDLLLHADEEVTADDLWIPHPELTVRAFVLVPLSELAMFARVPGDGRLVAELLEDVDRAGVREAHPPEALWPERVL